MLIAEIVEARGVCDSPLNTSFTKFNQKIQKFDMLKKRQSYSEFEELIEKKVGISKPFWID